MSSESISDTGPVSGDDCQLSNKGSEMATKDIPLTPWEHELCEAVAARSFNTVVNILCEPNRVFSQTVLNDCLLDACGLYKDMNQDLVKELLRSGADINAVSEDGLTPVLIAVKNGNMRLLLLLLHRGADVNAVTAEGDSALTLSVRPNRSLYDVELLLQQSGIDTNHKNHEGYTALMKAVETRDFEVTKLLIDDHKLHNHETLTISKDSLDSDEIIVKIFGQELFDVAARAGMVKVIKLLLHLKQGDSPLLEAALIPDVELVKILIDSHFCSIQKEYSSFTMFLQKLFQTKKQRNLAVGDVDIPIIKLLLENGTTVNKYEMWWTSIEPPLITVVEAGSLGLVQLMCKHGAKLDVTSNGKTPLDIAAESGKADILDFLLNKHDMVSEQNGEVTSKSSALHLCLMNEHVDCAKILLKHGYNIDLDIERFLPSGASIKAVSALIAVLIGDFDLLQFFLQEGADVNAVTAKGDSALTLSVRPNRSLDIIEHLLQQKGIDTNHINHQGYTALMKAIEARDIEVMKLLIDDYKLHNHETLTISKDTLDSNEIIVKIFGQELFDVATLVGMVKVIKLLLHTAEGESPLMEAALRADMEMVKMLLDSQFYNFRTHDFGVTTFLRRFFQIKKQKNLVVGDADIPVVELLLESDAAVNLYGERDWFFCNSSHDAQPLITAVEAGSLGLVQLMCKYGVNLDACANYKTILEVAAESGKADILQFLLNKHDMVSEQNGEVTSKSSALHLGLMNEHVDCAKILLKHGYNIDLDIERFLPSGASIKAVSGLIAVMIGDVDLLSFSLKEGADVNAVTAEGDSALTLSVRPNRSLDIIKRLLQQSEIDRNHKNRQGYTALMKAVEARDTEVMKLLIDDHISYNRETLTISEDILDSDETIISSFGQELFDIAARASMVKVIKLLLHIKQRESPLMEAALRADVELVKILIDSQFYDVNKEDSCNTNTMFLQNFFQTKKQRNLAIGDVDIPIIKLLLENGAAVNKSENSWGYYEPPVITAVEAGSLRLLQLMCEYGAKLDATTLTRKYENKTLLDVAADLGKADILQFLLSKHAKVSGHSGDITYKKSALHSCLVNGHTHCAEILMNHGYKIDVPSAAEYAFDYNKPAYLKFLLERFLSDVKNVLCQTRQKGNKLLTEAVKNDHVNIINNLAEAHVHLPDFLLSQAKSAAMVQLLVRKGASVNRRAKTTGNPVLLTLIRTGKNETSVAQIAKILLEKGANVNDCNLKGVTPLIAAAQTWESSELLNTLLLHGADVHKRDNEGMTAFMYAIGENYTENAKLLIQLEGNQKVDIEVQDSIGSTPLMLAATNNNTTITDLLLVRGANVNIQDQDGDTALISAIEDRNEAIANLLIDQGANVNIEDNNGDIALTLAARNNDVATIMKILDRGTNINHQNKKGYSALMIAACNLHIESMKVLLNAGADVNVVLHEQEKKTAFSLLFEAESYYNPTVYLLMDSLLDKGASSSYLKPDALFDLIQSNQWKLIPKLVSTGFGPAELSSEIYLHGRSERVAFPVVSPFIFALLYSHPKLARYFDGNWFLSTSDIQLQAKYDRVREILEERSIYECVDILDEFCSQPMSLLKLSFVAVSSAIGCVPGREARVEKLPLPPIIKEKLLFKKQEVQLDIPEESTNWPDDYYYYDTDSDD